MRCAGFSRVRVTCEHLSFWVGAFLKSRSSVQTCREQGGGDGSRPGGEVHRADVFPCGARPHGDPCDPAVWGEGGAAGVHATTGNLAEGAGVAAAFECARLRHLPLCEPGPGWIGGREKEDIAEIRRLQLDLDEDGAAGLARVFEDVGRGELPRPAHVLRSSKERYQILWDTVPGEWDMEVAEAVMRALAARYGGDRAATDVARVMRMPGFRNKKPGRGGALVTWAWHGGPLVRPEDFPGLVVPEQEPARRSGGRRRMPPGHYSQSERDWAAVGDALRSGEAPETVISRLEQQRQDKPNPGYYARRTVRRKEEELKRGLPDQRKRA